MIPPARPCRPASDDDDGGHGGDSYDGADDDDCGGDDDLGDGDNHCWLLLPRDGKWWPQEIELSFPRPLHICLEEALPACWAPSHHCTMCSCSPLIFLKEPRYEYRISYIAAIYWKLFLLFAATIPFTDHLSQFASQRYILPFLRCKENIAKGKHKYPTQQLGGTNNYENNDMFG